MDLRARKVERQDALPLRFVEMAMRRRPGSGWKLEEVPLSGERRGRNLRPRLAQRGAHEKRTALARLILVPTHVAESAALHHDRRHD